MMPVVRVVSVSELQFLTSLQYGVWGSSTARFKHWQLGELLVFVVRKAIAGLAEVSGEPFVSDEPIWEHDLWPQRIPIRFTYAISPEVRPTISGEIWDALIAAWGTRYGWGIAGQRALPGEAAELVLEAVEMRPNDLGKIRANLSLYLSRARQEGQNGVRTFKIITPSRRVKPVKAASVDDSTHYRAQSQLIRLGRAAGCSVWIASNDRNRLYEGRMLGEGCLKKFPHLGLPKEVNDRIALIDVIWIRRNMPVYAFEVEVTSAVYSGLLRMADLLALVPLLNVRLFVVAPRERQDKVMRELARPTFQKIGLSKDCRFIAAEDLETLLERVEQLGGHIQPSVVDTIAVELEAESSLN